MNLKLVMVLLFILSNLSFHNPTSEALQPIILILDGSGSMWGKIDAKTKIAIARDVVHDVLDNMDPNQSVGLVVYGHRHKSDCDDIETLIKPGIDNHEEIKKALNKINPTGKTPLANTALQVIAQLKKDQQSATLILISDGEESCNGDLCKVVKEAKEAGVDFVLHIVGFDLGDADQLALECAAKEGDGIYINAENGSQLSEALIKTTSLPVQKMEPTLSVKITKDGSPHDAVVRIAKSGENNYFISRRTYTEEKTNPTLFGIEPGTYDIEATPLGTNVTSIIRKGIVVSSDEIREVVIDFTAGKFSILTTGNGNLWDSVVNISKEGESKSIAKGRTYKSESSNPMIKELSPGFYDIKLMAMSLLGEKTSHIFKQVEIVAGQTTKVEHNYEFGEILVSGNNNGIYWDCVLNVNAGKKFLKGGRTGKGPNGKPSSYLLTPGIYNVLFKPHHIYAQNVNYTVRDIKVEAGSVQNVIHNYETGIARISVTNDDKLWKSVISIYQDEQLVYSKRCGPTSNTNPLEIHLTSGTYKVDVKPLKLDAEKHKFEILVKKGEILERLIEF